MADEGTRDETWARNIPKLKANNWPAWAFRMETTLGSRELLDLVTGERKTPVEPDDPPGETAAASSAKREKYEKDTRQWRKDNFSACSLIQQTLSAEMEIYARGIRDAKTLWDKLRDTHMKKPNLAVNLLNELVTFTTRPNELISSLGQRLIVLRSELQQADEHFARPDGVMITNSIANQVFINALPDSCMPLRDTFRNAKDLRVEDMIPRARAAAEEERATDKIDSEYRPESVMVASRGKSKDNRKGQGLTLAERKNKFACNTCGKKGHWKADCPNARTTSPAGPPLQRRSAHAAQVQAGQESWDEYSFFARPGKKDQRTDEWIVDTGATCHMAWNKSIFKGRLDYVNAVVSTASGAMKAAGQGNVRLSDGTLVSDVLYVPNLTRNLLSVAQLQEKGINIAMTERGLVLVDGENIVATASKRDRMYILDAMLPPGEMAFASTTEQRSQNREWLSHRRLGHPGKAVTKQAASGLVEGVTEDAAAAGVCEVCATCKSTRHIGHRKTERTGEKLALVHMDLWGPAQTPTYDGKRYMLTITDDHTRKVWVGILARKGDIASAFKTWKSSAELESGCRVKRIRSDNATEIIGQELRGHIPGVTTEQSVPYTPEQNGVAERMNRTLIDKARCMVDDLGVNRELWGEAVKTAAMIRNCMPVRGMPLTPEEAWSGRKPDLSHLRVFGARTFVHIPKQRSNGKLEPRSWVGTLVGYTGRSIFRVWNPQKRRVEASSHVQFDESRPGPSLASPPPKEESLVVDPTGYVETPSREHIEDIAEEAVGPAQPEGQQRQESPVEDREMPPQAEILTPQLPVSAPASGGGIEETATQSARSLPPDTIRVAAPGDFIPGGGPVVETPVEPARRSDRERQPPSRYGGFAMIKGEDAPKSYRDAMERPDAVEWKVAIDKELKQIEDQRVWELVELPEGRRAVSSKWVLTVKTKPDGTTEKLKARLVARGFSQTQGEDYDLTWSPTVRYDSLRVLLAMAATMDLEVHQMDVVGAYLTADLEEEVYLELPEGFRAATGDEHKVCRLRKALYGLKQSGRVWNKLLVSFLESIGFRQSATDPGIMIQGEGLTGGVVILMYVDDMLIIGRDIRRVVQVKKQLSRRFPTKDLGEVKSILNMQVTRDRRRRQLTLSQSSYCEKIMKECRMEGLNATATPMEEGFLRQLSAKETTVQQKADERTYQRAIGQLQYLACGTRPDIAFAVGVLGRFRNQPLIEHWNAIKRVFRYLSGTKDLCLRYGMNKEAPGGGERIGLCGYSDSDFAGDTQDRKSTGAYVFTLGGAAVTWSSKKQRTTATSTTEAEYMALFEAGKEAQWLRQMVRVLAGSTGNDNAVPLYEDNKAAMLVAMEPAYHPRTKHFGVQYHKVRELRQNGIIQVEYLPTEEMPADALTKALAKAQFEKKTANLGLVSVKKLLEQRTQQ